MLSTLFSKKSSGGLAKGEHEVHPYSSGKGNLQGNPLVAEIGGLTTQA
jgi:hypothetical protein